MYYCTMVLLCMDFVEFLMFYWIHVIFILLVLMDFELLLCLAVTLSQDVLPVFWGQVEYKIIVCLLYHYHHNGKTTEQLDEYNIRRIIEKNKSLMALEKFDNDRLMYCHKTNCTLQWAEKHMRKQVFTLESRICLHKHRNVPRSKPTQMLAILAKLTKLIIFLLF